MGVVLVEIGLAASVSVSDACASDVGGGSCPAAAPPAAAGVEEEQFALLQAAAAPGRRLPTAAAAPQQRGDDEAEASATATARGDEADLAAREVSGSCRDSSPGLCPRIHLLGYCELSEDVRQECKRSCHACGAHPPHPRPPAHERCEDLSDTESVCQWIKYEGFCSIGDTAAKLMCKKTCNFCHVAPVPAPPAGCEDKDPGCVFYRGLCEHDNVKELCPASCGTC